MSSASGEVVGKVEESTPITPVRKSGTTVEQVVAEDSTVFKAFCQLYRQRAQSSLVLVVGPGPNTLQTRLLLLTAEMEAHRRSTIRRVEHLAAKAGVEPSQIPSPLLLSLMADKAGLGTVLSPEEVQLAAWLGLPVRVGLE